MASTYSFSLRSSSPFCSRSSAEALGEGGSARRICCGTVAVSLMSATTGRGVSAGVAGDFCSDPVPANAARRAREITLITLCLLNNSTANAAKWPAAAVAAEVVVAALGRYPAAFSGPYHLCQRRKVCSRIHAFSLSGRCPQPYPPARQDSVAG